MVIIMCKRALGIYGAGGLGREVFELAKIINGRGKIWDSFIFVVDEVTVDEVNGLKVLKYEEAKTKYGAALDVAVGIGEPAVRKKKFEQLKKDGINTPTLIHPDVHIPETTVVGKGVVIQYGCFISCNVTIEDYVYIQPQCNIGHDDTLSEGCMISGFGNIAGNVKVGRFTYIGLSAAIKENVLIGDNSIIGMGSIVHKDIPNEVIALGNPARPTVRNADGKVFRH